MEEYIKQNESIYFKLDGNVEKTLETIANRYVGVNPPDHYIFRAFNKNSFKRHADYRYEFDMNRALPQVQNNQWAYAWGKLWSDEEKSSNFSASAFGPMRVYHNGKQVFKANLNEERDRSVKRAFSVPLVKGWNSFVIAFQKESCGFGGMFGTGAYKNFPFHFIVPSSDRDGQEGFIYAGPTDKLIDNFPELGMSEAETGMKWYPEYQWTEKEKEQYQLERLYKNSRNTKAFGWTKISFPIPGTNEYTLKVKSAGAIKVYMDGKVCFSKVQGGVFAETISGTYGIHDILVETYSADNGFGFELEAYYKNDSVELFSPYSVKGATDSWMYIGPFEKDAEIGYSDVIGLTNTLEAVNGKTYFTLDMPDTWVRPYLENTLFGKWNYPLGVTLYGLWQAGVLLKREDICGYVKKHVEACTKFYSYSLWDKEQYGAAGVNNQISNIDSLDDCGSFGSTMLELMKKTDIENGLTVAADVAKYIEEVQDRREDGALYRENSHSLLMVGTMWCDDLYMSTPFLTRYSGVTGDSKYIDDAAKQFLLYKKYLFIPEKKIMSHVYDFKHQMPTMIPWGRGNGWVIFSLSELLAVLPENHKDRPALLEFFNELSEGYLALQDEEGMWHQVLTDHESYRETSCTSMFMYSFARGIRFGWLKDTEKYTDSVFRGWKALCSISVDKYGDIFGVCKGSGFGFSGDYYKNDLSWNLNDTHGIGIVMLAGIETLQLREFLKNM